ncbi:type II toxin-antitoxin system RelE/ParE family toxin [Thermodesulfobacteriota bacterium]
MPYKLRIPIDTVSLIRGLHPQLKKKIRAALQEITVNPHTGKALKDELQGLWSYRIKKIRIIYQFTSKNYMDIITIGPRRCIYEETYKLLKKNK